jgi:hypothetical protein
MAYFVEAMIILFAVGELAYMAHAILRPQQASQNPIRHQRSH